MARWAVGHSKNDLERDSSNVWNNYISLKWQEIEIQCKVINDDINRLEPVEYDQTHDLVDHYTADAPQSHQCRFIAQQVQHIDELKYRKTLKNTNLQTDINNTKLLMFILFDYLCKIFESS